MTINYSKAATLLIIFLIWNIASPYFIDYQDPGPNEGIRYYTYAALWIIWFSASLLITILYLLDSKKNKKAGAPPPIISSGSRSKTADFLTSFMLGLGSLVLMHLALFITTDGFSLGTRGEAFAPGLGAAFFEIFFFLFFWMPAYFFILRKNISITKKVSKILIILAFTYLIIFIPQVVRHTMIQREKQQFYKENPTLQKILDQQFFQLKESKKKNQ